MQIRQGFLLAGVCDKGEMANASFGDCQQAFTKGAGVNAVGDLQAGSLRPEFAWGNGVNGDEEIVNPAKAG